MFIKLRWCVLLCLGMGASTAVSVLAAQDSPTTDGVVVVQGSADPLAGGGARRTTVVGLGFTVGPDLVLAYLPEDHGELMVLDANGRQLVAALRFRDSSSSLGLLSVPGLGVVPYSFVPADAVRPGQEVWGVAWDPVPDNDNRLLLEEGRVRAGDDPFPFDLLAPIEVESLGAAGFNLGAPVLNECGQVIGALSSNVEMAVSPARLQQIFSGEDWVAPRASQPCLAQEQVDLLDPAVQDSLDQMVQDSLDQMVQDSLDQMVQDSLAQAVQDSLAQVAQDSMAAMAARLRTLEARPVQDQNPEEIQRVQEEIRGLQELIESLRAPPEPEPQPSVPGWAIVMGISILAALGLAGVVRLRSGAGAGHAVVEPSPVQHPPPSTPQIAPPPPSAPSVFLEGSDKKGNRFSVAVPADALDSQDGVVVGRNPYQSTVVLDHPEVSRRHFRMYYSGGRILVEDLGSTNKTRVGNAVLTPGVRAELREGDMLHVGSLALRPTIRR